MSAGGAIIIMAKQPRAGKTKTRLCPPFTIEGAAVLFEALLRDTIELAAGLEGIQLAIAISPPEARAYFSSISPPGTLLLPIEGANIGICLEKALEGLLERKFKKVIALNADGPSLPREYLVDAFRLLDSNDVVLGPGEDGGYYLVGLKQMNADIFADIPWSTSAVLEKTLAQAAQSGLRTALTPTWYDVDIPADVDRLIKEINGLPAGRLPYTRRFFQQYSSLHSLE